jgi:hypothetical protein
VQVVGCGSAVATRARSAIEHGWKPKQQHGFLIVRGSVASTFTVSVTGPAGAVVGDTVIDGASANPTELLESSWSVAYGSTADAV